MTNLDGIFKSRDITLPTKVRLVKAMVFPVVTCGCESWTIKKAERWRIDAFELVLEKTLESSLDCKEIQPVHPKGNQSWIFIGRTDAEAPILGPPAKKELTHLKRPWCWERLKVGEGDDRMRRLGWHHWLNGHEFEQALGVGDGQGGLACYSPWVTRSWTRVSDWTELMLKGI